MSRWKQWVKQPAGALPGGLVTKVGIGLIGVLVAGLLFSSSLSRPDEDAAATGTATESRTLNDSEGRSLAGCLRDETERESQRADAEGRDESSGGRGDGGEAGSPGGGETSGTDGPGGGRTPSMGSAEFELREALRLEEVERRTRSLRSFPVAQSHRDPEGSPDAAASPLASESPDAALDGALASLGRSSLALRPR